MCSLAVFIKRCQTFNFQSHKASKSSAPFPIRVLPHQGASSPEAVKENEVAGELADLESRVELFDDMLRRDNLPLEDVPHDEVA